MGLDSNSDCYSISGRRRCVETHETWLEDNRYLNMTFLTEQKKELLRLAA